MDIRSDAVGTESAVGSNNEAPRHGIPTFNNDAERRDWLIETLGEPFCRKLGLFRYPGDSDPLGRHPGLQRAGHDPRDPPAGACGPDQEADHRGRRLLDATAPARSSASWKSSDGDLKVVYQDDQPGQGGRAAHRVPARHRRHRHRPGRRPRVRPGAVSRSSSSRSSRTRPTSSSARGSSARRTACSISGIRWRTSSSRSCRTCSPT